MPALALNTSTTLSFGPTPPMRFSCDAYAEGERVTIRQAGVHLSYPVADTDRVIAALLAVKEA